MGAKAEYIEALRSPFDEEIMDIIHSRVLPELPDVTPGTDTESAMIAMSQYAANCNAFLQMFEGVPLLEYLLAGCTMTPVFHNIHLSGIEYQERVVGNFKITYPPESESMSDTVPSGDTILVRIKITKGTLKSATCLAVERLESNPSQGQATLEQVTDDIWAGDLDAQNFSFGVYDLTVFAQFEDMEFGISLTQPFAYGDMM